MNLPLADDGTALLDGQWEFFPGDHELADLDALTPDYLTVPGLWEAQGWLELDGVAWCRRTFDLDDTDGWWSLRFGAVMDLADVWVNGSLLGSHDNPFTPFVVDPTPALRIGTNVVAVRIVDPKVDDPEHIRMAHGKQGWANHVFPSRPSLYMTYGGIWQSVGLRRHGPVVIDDVFVNGEPDDLVVEITVSNRTSASIECTAAVRVVGRLHEVVVDVPAGGATQARVEVGATHASRWTIGSPALHDAVVDVRTADGVSDSRTVRFGLRTIRVEGTRVLINGEPYRMKSALVQGFRGDRLYAEGDRDEIMAEVRAAQAMGFNTLRLHIKAFDPAYLDVCDELGMLLHCDIPVAEPIDHENLGALGDSVIATRSVQAVLQQITRDRNHPSIVLWSVMNELCLDRMEARYWDRYETFARALVAAAKSVDPTRPVIENDWVEPEPERVFAGDVLTAHWYGRLHAEYLDKIEQSCRDAANLDRPLYVTEFGDWGLPDMPQVPEPPFWDPRSLYAAGLTETRWPASMGRFVTETHRYQGLSDRLQAEVFRRHDHIGGYCLTELTDVPHELNGVLDLDRRPKRTAVEEVRRGNQTVLPMLRLGTLVVVAGELIVAPLHVANDGPQLDDVEVDIRFGNTGEPLPMDALLRLDTSAVSAEDAAARFTESLLRVRTDHLGANRATWLGDVTVEAPLAKGSHDLVVRLRAGGIAVSENRYTLHVVGVPCVDAIVALIGDDPALPAAVDCIGGLVDAAGVAVVGEGALDAKAGDEVRRRLARGEVVVVLAQPETAAAWFPVPAELFAVATKWGSSVFHFTTDHGAVPSLPRRNLLVAEDSTVQAHGVVTRIDGNAFPDTPVVIAYKPVPGAMTGTIIGSHQVGPGRLVVCQYRLTRGAAEGDAAARALLADVISWAARPRRVLGVEESFLSDGRRARRYSHRSVVAR